jgi:hypothetical protein
MDAVAANHPPQGTTTRIGPCQIGQGHSDHTAMVGTMTTQEKLLKWGWIDANGNQIRLETIRGNARFPHLTDYGIRYFPITGRTHN